MALSSIDYEKVDVGLLSILQMLGSLESIVSNTNNTTLVPNTNIFINAIDDYRNEVGLMIEKQGRR